MKGKSNLLTLILMFFIGLNMSVAQTPRDLEDLIGMRASYLDSEMRDRGYSYVSASKNSYSSTTTWYNDIKNKCVKCVVVNGEVNRIENNSSGCYKNNYNNYSSNNYENNYYKNNNHYRYNTDNDYHSYNHDYYDNTNYNKQTVSDLVNRDAESAYSTLRDRGFDEVKKHTSNGKTYKVFYNSNTKQCIKTTSDNRRIRSIENSTHCNL